MVDYEKAQQVIDQAHAEIVRLEAEEAVDCVDYRNLLTLAKDLMPKFGQRMVGRVRWYNEKDGYGFVSADDGGPDAFIHKRALNEAALDTLREGDRLEYTMISTAKGLQARSIVRLR